VKFSAVLAGKRNEEPASFRFYGTEVATLLVPLSDGEELEAEGEALRLAKAKGADGGSSVYGRFHRAAVLVAGCKDPDSSPEKRTPTFDGGIPQVLSMDPDETAMLFERHQLMQEMVSPSRRRMSVNELFALAKKLVEEDERDPFAFARFSRVTQLTLVRFMASLLRLSHVFSSSPGGSSGIEGKVTTESVNPSPSQRDASSSPTTTPPTGEKP
jgi:hypothetical protein